MTPPTNCERVKSETFCERSTQPNSKLAFARLPNLATTNYCKRCKRKTPLMAGFSRITPKRT